MLIRLTGHFINNSQHIDKMICIKGLPDDWVFRKRLDGQKELAPPFTADISENIPKFIRHLCTPMDVVKYFPPIEKGKEGIIDKMTILGVRLDYMTEAGRAMWTQIQRYTDDCLPRHAKVPEPVLVAKDQKSPFETYSAYKRITGGVELTPAEIPVIDLDAEKEALLLPIPPLVAVTVALPPSEPVVIILQCNSCDFVAKTPNGLKIHAARHSKSKVKVGTMP
jgi:hypothetical protein